jgi:Phage gp6-like head-tail connector protein
MADPSDLTTLANLKSWLNVTTTADDVLLQRLITAVSGFIATWLDRPVAEARYEEMRDGSGGRCLVFAVSPVSSVASVSIGGRPVPPSLGGGLPGYLFSSTRLALLGYRFSKGCGNVFLSYTAGYADIPPDIEQAAIELAAARYRERDRIGLVTKGLAGDSTQFVLRDMPPDVATLLSQYRKVVPV